MRRSVEVIPAKPMKELKGLEITAKTRVCAYCRVSTSEDEQISSFEAQVSHYSSYIKSNPEWDFLGIYADEGISGTNTKKRVEFNRMIEDCMTGKIDMIITKSISRFARNTLDCLQYVRQLKEKNIAVFFEKENVNTLDSKGDFMISLLGSLAQEESNNLSKVTRLGIVYRFQEGKIRVNHNWFLGYTKDEKGELVIVPEEAEVIKRIYTEFLEGKSCNKIARGLMKDKIRTGSGGEKWYESTVKKILKNEKYMGDALLQKSYTIDFLNKKRVNNRGHVAQYYVEDSHPAIISKEDFTAVQAEFVRRSNMRGYSKTGKSAFTSSYAFSGKLFCQNCGSKFRRVVWGTGKNKKHYWLCINHEMNGTDSCNMKAVAEKELEQAFIRAMNKVIGDKDDFLDQLINNILKGLEKVEQEYSMSDIDDRLLELQQEIMSLVRLNAKTGFDTQMYDKEYTQLASEIELMRERRQKLKEAEADRVLRINRIEELKDYLQNQDASLKKFDEDLFRRLIEKVKVQSLVEAVFIFKTGVEVREILG